ncbi:putative reverse transcriptase, RNA-dependent DNA polymerase [Plasmopara halstedii]
MSARKYDERGNVVRHKARLVTRGFLQTHGVDYFDAYSPVASMNTIRTFLYTLREKDYAIRQHGVETAFLNGDLKEIVHMHSLEDIKVEAGMVWKFPPQPVWL